MIAVNSVSVRGRVAWLAAAMLVAAALRVGLAWTMPCISRDGITFIGYAQRLQESPREEMRRQKQHPLFPAAVLAAARGLERIGLGSRDEVVHWTRAGKFVSIVAGVGLVPAMYLLARILFNARVGLVAAFCTAVLPELCRYGGDVLSDSLHLLCYVLGLAVGLSGLQRRSLLRLAGAGVLAGLAFLVRPEGGEVALVVCAAACLPRWYRATAQGGPGAVAPPWRWHRRLAASLICASGFALVAAPYMGTTGRIIQKKSPLRFLGQEADAGPCGAATLAQTPGVRHCEGATCPALAGGTRRPSGRTLRASVDALAVIDGVVAGVSAAGKTMLNWVRSLRVMYLLPAVAWFFLGHHRPRPAVIWPVPAATWFLHAGVCVLLICRFDYWNLFSMRHVLVLAALTLPLTAAGLVGLADLLASRLRPGPPIWLVWVALGVSMVGPTLPWLLRAPNQDYAYLRDVGEWIARHYPPPQRILTDQWHVPFYARGVLSEEIKGAMTNRWQGTANAADLCRWIKRQRPDLVVLDEGHLLRDNAGFFADLDKAAVQSGTLRLVYSHSLPQTRGRPRGVRVYEVRP